MTEKRKLKIPESSPLAKRLAKKQIAEALWRQGNIRELLLDPNQLSMVAEWEKSSSLAHVFLCSRRLGKTFILCTVAAEYALRRPFSQIKIISATKNAVREFVQPNMRKVIRDAPKDCFPDYKIHESKYVFPNGSEILLIGIDKDPDSMRGQSADLVLIDEAGFTENLSYTVREVINPMVIETGGRILMASTPPNEEDHDFLFYIERAREQGALTVRTLHDCPRFTQKQISQFIEESGGLDSEAVQREYFCRIILSKENTVVPEFNEDSYDDIVYEQHPVYPYVPDKYVSMDPGMADNAAILFGHWDFEQACLYITREHVEKGQNTAVLAEHIYAIERELWRGLAPYKRVSDTDLRLIEDLRRLHNLHFSKPDKRDKEVRVNQLRIAVKSGQIKIHKSCTHLITQLKLGKWKTSSTGKREFKRSEELGHLDCIDALLYMWQAINKHRNPIPPEVIGQESAHWGRGRARSVSRNADALRSVFKG
jgi:hypothetical protein